MPKKKLTEAEKDRQEIADRKARQDFKKQEARNAYPKVKKAWDFGRLGTKQVLDTTRQMERKKKK